MDLSLLTSPKSKVNSIAPIMNGRFIATSDQAGFFYEMGDKRYKVNNVEFIASNAGITASTPGVNETLYFNTSNRILYAWNSTTSTLDPITSSDENVVKFHTPTMPATFADATWKQITTLAEYGLAPAVFKIGESKQITDTNGTNWTIQIVGFNHDNLSYYSGTAGITFRVFPTNHDIYSIYRDTWTGGTTLGYIGSNLESAIATHSANVFEALGITANVKSVLKDTYNTQSGGVVSATPMKAFAFASTEISTPGTGSLYLMNYGHPHGTEGNVYDYFKNSKLMTNEADSMWEWWTRSFDSQFASTGRFASVSNKYISSYYCTANLGVVFGFCL